MSVLDFVLIALTLGAAIYVIWFMHRQKKKGKACCGNCSGCTANCTQDNKKGELKNASNA